MRLTPAHRTPTSKPTDIGQARPVSPAERADGPVVEGIAPLSDLAAWSFEKAGGLVGRAPVPLAKAQRRRREAIALALAGVTVFNAFAPLWGPAVGNAASPATRLLDAGLRSELLQQAKGSSTFDLLASQLGAAEGRAPPLLDQADAGLSALDDALQMPSGTARELGVRRALLDVGVEPSAARAAAALVAHADDAAAGLRHLQQAVRAGTLDLDDVGHDAAALLDKVLSDPHVTLCFVAGFALVPAPVQHSANAIVKVGKVLVDAKLRHDHAVNALKQTDSGNAAVDAIARLAGEAVDAVSFAAMFLGPGPILNAARGTDLLLVASELVAAKTAVKATAKSLAAYSALPEDVAALALGVVAAAELRDGARDLGVDGQAAVEHAASVTGGVRDAVAAGDSALALDVIKAAWDDMTPHERDALQTILRRGAERVVMNAGA